MTFNSKKKTVLEVLKYSKNESYSTSRKTDIRRDTPWASRDRRTSSPNCTLLDWVHWRASRTFVSIGKFVRVGKNSDHTGKLNATCNTKQQYHNCGLIYDGGLTGNVPDCGCLIGLLEHSTLDARNRTRSERETKYERACSQFILDQLTAFTWAKFKKKSWL